jgi:hypothetical protein
MENHYHQGKEPLLLDLMANYFLREKRDHQLDLMASLWHQEILDLMDQLLNRMLPHERHLKQH